MDKQSVAFFVADSNDLNNILIFINGVKNTELRYSKLEFREFVGAEAFPITGLSRRFVGTLIVYWVDD